MPVITIKALSNDGVDIPAALARVTTTVATLLDEDPRGTWAVFEPIAPGHFAEGGHAPEAQPAGTHPALVTVAANRPEELVPELLRTVSTAVTDAFGLAPGNAFVVFERIDPERLYAGGG